jgi:hypothetical protein
MQFTPVYSRLYDHIRLFINYNIMNELTKIT